MKDKFLIMHKQPEPLDEQEAVLTWDKDLKQWHIYTDDPVLARKYESLVEVDENYRSSKTYHSNTGELIGLEGRIIGTVSISKKREYTDAQRKAMSERMKKIVAESS